MSLYGPIANHLNVDAVERRLVAERKEIENARFEDKQQPEPLREFLIRSWQKTREDRQRAYEALQVKAAQEHLEELGKFKAKATCQNCGLEFPYYKRISIDGYELCETPQHCLPCHKKKCEEKARWERMDNFWDRNPLSGHYLCELGKPPRPAQFDAVMKWQGWSDEGERLSLGLVLVGDSFTGKTTAVYRLARKLVEAWEYGTFLAVNSTQLNAIPEKVLDRTIGPFMQELLEAELLLIDDLDKVRITPRVASELWGLFERRLREECAPIFITMNTRTKRDFIRLFSGRDADSRQIGLSIYNRLHHACQFIDFDVETQPVDPPVAGEGGESSQVVTAEQDSTAR